MSTPPHVEIILLAAGASTRLGRLKQLLPYKGNTLLRHTVRQATTTDAARVRVVLGFERMILQEHIQDLRVTVVPNDRWAEGLSSSIQAGLKSVPEDVDAVVLMLCDMPQVTSEHVNALIRTQQEEHKGIVASRYANDAGVPVLFERRYFPDLQALTGDKGARDIVLHHSNDVAFVDLPGGDADIDTYEDVQRLER